MLIMTQGDALASGVGPADGNVFSAEIVGAGKWVHEKLSIEFSLNRSPYHDYSIIRLHWTRNDCRRGPPASL